MCGGQTVKPLHRELAHHWLAVSLRKRSAHRAALRPHGAPDRRGASHEDSVGISRSDAPAAHPTSQPRL